MTAPTVDILTGSRWGTWPNPGDAIDDQTADVLMDIYERMHMVEETYTKFYTSVGYWPVIEQARSANRQEFMIYIWDVLDVPVPVKIGRAA